MLFISDVAGSAPVITTALVSSYGLEVLISSNLEG